MEMFVCSRKTAALNESFYQVNDENDLPISHEWVFITFI